MLQGKVLFFADDNHTTAHDSIWSKKEEFFQQVQDLWENPWCFWEKEPLGPTLLGLSKAFDLI